jgi:hypothetical protein
MNTIKQDFVNDLVNNYNKAKAIYSDFEFGNTLFARKVRAMSTIDGFVNMLQFCNSLTDYVPTSEDPITKKVFKVAGGAKVLISNLKPTKSLRKKFIEERGLIFRNDPGFVNVFRNSDIKKFFIHEYLTLAKADQYTTPGTNHSENDMHGYHSDEFGSIWFTEINSAHGSRGHGDLYHTEGFNFEAVLEKFWDVFEYGINVETAHNQLKYTAMPKNTAPFTGYGANQAKRIAEKHNKYIRNKVPRVTMFVGPPGVGKSTLVLKTAQILSSRVIRIEAESLVNIVPKDMMFLLGGLRPGCLIVDDVDRAFYNTGLSRVFTVLDWMKQKHPEVPMFMTANRVSHLDSALMRPGRVDEVEWCNAPGIKNRLAILNTYLKSNGVESLDIEDKIKIVKATKGLAIAWIKEVALQIKYEPIEMTLMRITNMKKLSHSLSYSYGDESEEIYAESTESDDQFESEDEEWDLFKDRWAEMDEEEKKEKEAAEAAEAAEDEEDEDDTELHACTPLENGMAA